MKRVWLMLLVILMIFTLVSCSNGKNGATKEVTTIKEESIQEQKFEIEPYSWVSKSPIIKDSDISNSEGSWQFECERYKKLKEEGKKELEDSHKLGERLILYIKIRFVNDNNLHLNQPFPPSIASSVVTELIDNQLIFDVGNEKYKKKLNYERYYDIEDGEIKDEIIVFIRIIEGESRNSIALKLNLPIEDTKEFYDINKDKSILPSGKELFSKILPVHLAPLTFAHCEPGKDFYKGYDLYIDEVDLNGTIKGKYGDEEFIISAGSEWQSKMNKQELSRDLFVYDWPYKENGEWKKVDKHKIIIRGKRKLEKGGWTSSEATFLLTNDKEILKISKDNSRYSLEDFNKIYELIKKKHPNFELNFEPNEWDRIAIGDYDFSNFDNILPKNNNPIFVSQIKIINYGWKIYYY